MSSCARKTIASTGYMGKYRNITVCHQVRARTLKIDGWTIMGDGQNYESQ
jgi:hypothetical protein